MPKKFEAIYENGILKPLEPLDLSERQKVSLTLHENGSPGEEDAATTEGRPRDDLDELDPEIYDIEYMRWCGEFSKDAPTLEAVHKITSKFKGSWADEIIAERAERIE